MKELILTKDMMVREAVVSGKFYPENKDSLMLSLEELMPPNKSKCNALGVVSPHAGYMYSGSVAGKVFASIKPKETYIILGPNHTGSGPNFSISNQSWETPLGKVELDYELCEDIKKQTNLVEEDNNAHVFEHSIEVQIPFLQKISENCKIVPIAVKRATYSELEEVALSIASCVKDKKDKVTLIASSDMTHYESQKSADKKDTLAIDRMLKMDPKGLFEVVAKKDISMCGVLPVCIMLIAIAKLGASKSKLIQYLDSSFITKDTSSVVGYAGLVFE